MKDKFFVPFETAKALKEKGYSQNCSSYWRMEEGENPRIVDYWLLDKDEDRERGYSHISAPTYHEMLDWLEEKYNIRIVISYDWCEEKWEFIIQGITYDTWHGSREEALNAAILKALELI